MITRYKKPHWVPSEFIIATRQGWVDSRTNEVLESIPDLVERLADYELYQQQKLDIDVDYDVLDAPYGINSYERKGDQLNAEHIDTQQEYQAHHDLATNKVDNVTINDMKNTDSMDTIIDNGSAKSKAPKRGRPKSISTNIIVK